MILLLLGILNKFTIGDNSVSEIFSDLHVFYIVYMLSSVSFSSLDSDERLHSSNAALIFIT